MTPTLVRALPALGLALLLGASAHAQDAVTTTDPTPGTDSTTVLLDPGGQKVADEFRDFLGDDADAVVAGLRNGESFTVNGPATDTTGTDPGAITDPTGSTGATDPTATDPTLADANMVQPATDHLGYGEVRHTLEMSRFLLQGAGVEQPTAAELDAVLNGGTVTGADGTAMEFEGVLALRESGMGWGRIAQEYGVKLGHVKNGRAVFDPEQAALSVTEPAAPDPGDATGATTGETGTGITTGTGESFGSAAAGGGIVDATGSTAVRGNGHARGRGIVDATGASSTGTAPVIRGNGKARGHGIVSGAGAAATGRGRGIVDATGAGATSHGSRGVVNAVGATTGAAAAGNARGQGIVNGIGASNGGGNGRGHVVDALGASGGGRGHGGVHTGGGGGGNPGRGHAHGRNK